jgi:hypothetical protein
MNRKLDLSNPEGYPPLSDNSGNKKKLNGPNHSGLLSFNTFGLVTTIRIMAGKSNQVVSTKSADGRVATEATWLNGNNLEKEETKKKKEKMEKMKEKT